MINFFNLLNLPQQFQLSEEQIKAAFQTSAARNHPDQGGDPEIFKKINAAQTSLLSEQGRLRHLLELADIKFDPRGSVSNEIMDFFMSISDIIQAVDEHLKKLTTANSALQKALLASKSVELQGKIEDHIDTIDSALNSTRKHAEPVTLKNISHSSDYFQQLTRDFAFLEKWKAELRSRYAQLFI